MLSLHVKDNRIVDSNGSPVQLRGTCIGGWMNMENFIDGYPGIESGVRGALSNVLGPGLAQFFFERWLDYFLAEEDIAFVKSLGANVVRLALNYRHFENDASPFYYCEDGFLRLDRALEWCARQGIYAILDLHAVQGWQNPDWHCDNPNSPALFWEHPHFEDRWIALWKELASRYKRNPTIAGYDVMNEPQTQPLDGPPRPEALNTAFRRVVRAIRAIDPDHIIFVEGDGFAGNFECMDAPFAENLAYSGHSYSPAAFGPGRYPGRIMGRHWDRDYMYDSNLRHQAFPYSRRHNVPLWMGEFGATYSGHPEEIPDRMRALDDQIEIFEEQGAHWTTWTYKDVGIMGWVSLDPDSDYMQLIAPVLEAKRELEADQWMGWIPSGRAGRLAQELATLVCEAIGDGDLRPVDNLHHFKRAALSGYAATRMQPAWAKRFRGMGEVELDRVLQSFALRNCRPRQDLIEVVQKHMR